MKHMANSMKKTTSQSDEVWYIDSRASNHMTSHDEWFSYLEKLEQLGVVKTRDDTLHPIKHVGEVPLIHVGQKGRLMNVLHVPTITQSLVSVGHIVDKGMQVRSPTSCASSRKTAKSSCKGVEKGECSPSTQMTSAPHYLSKVKKSNRISTCGISESAT